MTTSVGFSGDGFDWDHYARVRPRYPDSLWTRILDYHHSHSHTGQLLAAHDVGAGHGIVAKDFLLPNFKHVFVSDPAPYNVNTAQRFLEQDTSSGNVTFKTCGGETPWLPEASVDMITAFECVHWMETEEAIPNMTAALKPGGTLAVVFYFPEPFIRENQQVGQAWQKVWNKFSEQLQDTDNWDFMRKVLQRSSDGLNSAISLPPALFQPGAQRIRINADLLKGSPHGNCEHPFHFTGLESLSEEAASHVTEHDECFSVVDHDWTQSVDLAWLKGVMQGLQPALPEDKSVQEFTEIHDALKRAQGETSVFWVVDIVLATKK